MARWCSEQIQVIEAEARARVDAEDARCNLMADAIRQREIEIETKGYEIRKVDRQVDEVTQKHRLKTCIENCLNRKKLQQQRAFFSWKNQIFDQDLVG